MTALDRYVRLESDALWRESPDAQRRDVVISFGNATLVIADHAARPLSHWSLTALDRLNPGERPAVYAPDSERSELLEISDATMIEAIEEVRKALAKSRPHPGKLRLWLTAGLIALVVIVATIWLPGALTRQTLAVVPQPKRVEIGMTMLSHMTATAGPRCQTPRASVAAARLVDRLIGAESGARLLVLPELTAGVLNLPGGLIVIDQSILLLVDDPAAASGFILAAHAQAQDQDPLADLLAKAGLGATLRLLTTGQVEDAVLQAEALRLAQTEGPLPSTATLGAALSQAGIPHGPYLAAVDQLTGSMPDFGQDPLRNQAFQPLLSDSDWVSLRNVCDN